MVPPSAERLDRLKRLVAAGAVPVVVKFGLMSTSPFNHEAEGARRELAGDDLEVFNVDRTLVVGVGSVKVRSTEVVALVVIHPDHDPVEGADPRHSADRGCRIGRSACGPASVIERHDPGTYSPICDARSAVKVRRAGPRSEAEGLTERDAPCQPLAASWLVSAPWRAGS